MCVCDELCCVLLCVCVVIVFCCVACVCVCVCVCVCFVYVCVRERLSVIIMINCIIFSKNILYQNETHNTLTLSALKKNVASVFYMTYS